MENWIVTNYAVVGCMQCDNTSRFSPQLRRSETEPSRKAATLFITSGITAWRKKSLKFKRIYLDLWRERSFHLKIKWMNIKSSAVIKSQIELKLFFRSFFMAIQKSLENRKLINSKWFFLLLLNSILWVTLKDYFGLETKFRFYN